MLSDHDEVPVPPSPLLVPIICGFGLAVLVGLCREELRPRRVLGRLLWLQRAVRTSLARRWPPPRRPWRRQRARPGRLHARPPRRSTTARRRTADVPVGPPASPAGAAGPRCTGWWRRAGRRVPGVYNPTFALGRPVAERFPPHAEEWGRAPAGPRAPRSSSRRRSTTHHPGGSAATHDVTDMLRRRPGRLPRARWRPRSRPSRSCRTCATTSSRLARVLRRGGTDTSTRCPSPWTTRAPTPPTPSGRSAPACPTRPDSRPRRPRGHWLSPGPASPSPRPRRTRSWSKRSSVPTRPG